MVRAGIDGVRVINNYFDVDGIEAKSGASLAPEHEHLFDGPPVIVTAGRLAQQKNQAPLLEAFARLRGDTASRLLILGDGPLRGDLLAEAARFGLRISSPWNGIDNEADVHFLGVQANPFAFIARSALFVLPSAWEGFPLALCEAMACRKAVVSADCPTGPREILAPSSPVPTTPITFAEEAPYGILMPIPGHDIGSIEIWADTLASLLADADCRERMAEVARKRVTDFTADAIVPQWRALLEELLET
ncbi:glycosyltransferase [Sphingomonas sp. HDW15A]|uniref:glycosyltransferase n=1 Tax=Sphingomonas sp. HDW15A TaxID=2714942 RepID=UPI00140E3C7C|nr:glycosyltransferase [Sphingomonas sp. HDW15A]QIK95834.1 glycosyltransferase [Sphingomonas sp. HDW15A]